MKKLLIATICGFATIASAETFQGVPSGRTTITQASDPNNALILDSSVGPNYSGIKETTYRSVSVTNGSSVGSFNMANGGLTLDANVASGDFNILTAANWAMNHTYLFLKNSVEDSTANLILNVNNFYFVSGSAGQNQTMRFDSGKFTVNTSSTSKFEATVDGKIAKLEVFTGSNVTWNGALTMEQNSVYDIYGKVSHDTGSLRIEKGSVATIYEGGHLYKSASGSLVIAGTLNVQSGGKLETVAGSSLALTGTLNVDGYMELYKISTGTGVYNQTSGSTKMHRGVNVQSGSNWTIYEKVVLEGATHKSDLSATCATLTIDDGATFVIKNNENGKAGNRARLLFNGYNNLVLNKENGIVDENGKAVSLATVAQTKEVEDAEGKVVQEAIEVINNKMTINADQTFRSLYLGDFASLDIIMGDGVNLTFTEYVSFNTASDNAFLNIFNFQENTIKFNNESSGVLQKIESYIKLYGATEEDFLGFAKVSDAGFLTLITVPEPAEWAMIFGAIALGLAIYRRRK